MENAALSEVLIESVKQNAEVLHLIECDIILICYWLNLQLALIRVNPFIVLDKYFILPILFCFIFII